MKSSIKLFFAIVIFFVPRLSFALKGSEGNDFAFSYSLQQQESFSIKTDIELFMYNYGIGFSLRLYDFDYAVSEESNTDHMGYDLAVLLSSPFWCKERVSLYTQSLFGYTHRYVRSRENPMKQIKFPYFEEIVGVRFSKSEEESSNRMFFGMGIKVNFIDTEVQQEDRFIKNGTSIKTYSMSPLFGGSIAF